MILCCPSFHHPYFFITSYNYNYLMKTNKRIKPILKKTDWCIRECSYLNKILIIFYPCNQTRMSSYKEVFIYRLHRFFKWMCVQLKLVEFDSKSFLTLQRLRGRQRVNKIKTLIKTFFQEPKKSDLMQFSAFCIWVITLDWSFLKYS